MSERKGRTALRGALAAAALLVTGGWATGAAAQETDGRWLPWLGCWVPVEATGEAPLTCVVPAEGGGVELRAVAASGTTTTRALSSAASERPADESGCQGTERAEFSSDGRRVYLSADLTCEGGVERETRGLMAMVRDGHWIEVQALAVEGRSVAWVKRYRPAPLQRVEAAGLGWLHDSLNARERAVEVARMAASAPITVDAIVETTARTDPEAVKTWLMEYGEPVELDAERLVRLAEGGVPPEVIDVAVAVSYPERFQVARESEDGRVPDAYGTVNPWGYPGYYDPFYSDMFGYSRYGYSRYGYGGYFGYPSYYGWTRPTVVVVRPTTEDNQGRMVKGRGYTRGGSGSASAGSGASVQARPSRPSSASTPAASTGSSSRPSKGKAKPRGGG